MSSARDRKFKSDLQKAIKDTVKKDIDQKITESDLASIGERVISKMKQQIARGISPIMEWGRFPEYKSRTAKRSAKETRRLAKNLGRAAKSTSNRQIKKQIRERAKTLRGIAKGQSKKGYPDNLPEIVKIATGKKARPVNLKLFGDFLDALEARVFSKKLHIGYFDKDQEVKEKGHREGANGQYPRPTIPDQNERFNASVQAELLKAIDQVLKKRL